MKTRPMARHLATIRFCVLLTIAQLAVLAIVVLLGLQRLYGDPTAPWSFASDLRRAQIFRGQLVYPKRPLYGKWVLQYIDLKTGEGRQSEPLQTFGGPTLQTMSGRLWAVTNSGVEETDGFKTIFHPAAPVFDLGMTITDTWREPFILHERLAQFEVDSSGSVHLCQFIDGTWKDTGQLLLPGWHVRWKADDATGEARIDPAPLLPGQSNRPVVTGCVFCVVPTDGTNLVFQFEPSVPRVLYRSGLEFEAPDVDPASALAPANTEMDFRGWRLVDSTTLPLDQFQWDISATTIDGQIYFVINNEILRFRTDDQSAAMARFERPDFGQALAPDIPQFYLQGYSSPRPFDWGNIRLVIDPDTQDAFVVVATETKDIDVFQLKGDSLQKLPFHIKGWGWPIVRLVGEVMLEMAAVFLLGTVFLVLQAGWILKRTTAQPYTFGHTTVKLASLERRALARFIDLMLILSPLAFQVAWTIAHTNADTLWFSGVSAIHETSRFLRSLIPPTAGSIWAVLAVIAMVASTGVWGVTPGKSLCGLRVVRTTLRPCGLASALARELILWLDTPLLLTALPGILCVLATPNRQRLGDVIADTIVIEK